MVLKFLGGIAFGTFLLLFIAWVDEKFLGQSRKVPKSKFKFYLIASAWELLFFIAGLFFGKFII